MFWKSLAIAVLREFHVQTVRVTSLSLLATMGEKYLDNGIFGFSGNQVSVTTRVGIILC